MNMFAQAICRVRGLKCQEIFEKGDTFLRLVITSETTESIGSGV